MSASLQRLRLGLKMMRGWARVLHTAATSIWPLFNIRQPRGIGEKGQSPFCGPFRFNGLRDDVMGWWGTKFLPCLWTTWIPWPPAAASCGPLRPSRPHPKPSEDPTNGIAPRTPTPPQPIRCEEGLWGQRAEANQRPDKWVVASREGGSGPGQAGQLLGQELAQACPPEAGRGCGALGREAHVISEIWGRKTQIDENQGKPWWQLSQFYDDK